MSKVKPGDVVFFKRCKDSSSHKSKFVEFHGHGFGIILGHHPLFLPDPTLDQILFMVGQQGFIKFDDVAEFLGVDAIEICLKKWDDKYNPAPPVPTEPEPERKLIV